MKNLFITNYQKTIPPFIFNEMKFSSKCYDKVIYVNPKLKNDNRDELISDNIVYFIGNAFDYIIGFLKFLFIFFSRTSMSNLKAGFTNKKAGFSFIVNHLHKLYNASVLSIILKRASRRYKVENNTFLSCWFDSSALAFCFFKCDKKKKNSFYTFAHSYEVNPSRNKFVGVNFDKQIVLKVKTVFFISQTILDLYFDNCIISSIMKNEKNKFEVRYLGVENACNLTYKFSPVFTLLSVSSVIELKRIDKIIECLSTFDKQIKWIHIGDGPLLPHIKELASLKLEPNKNVKYEFLGHLPNTKVLTFLNDNKIDAFLNVSSVEGISVAIMEALSFGIPIIATDVGGTKEIVTENVGILIKDSCPIDELEKAIKRIYLLNDQEKNSYFKKCRERWDSLFNLEKNAYNYYNKL